MPREEKSPEVFAEIDENLRRAYEELLNEALPHRFKDLIQQLKEKDSGLEISVSDGEKL